MNPEHKLIPATKARADFFGGISAMTEWRWTDKGILPRPIKINGRNFYREADLIAVQERFARESAESAE